VPSRDGFIRGNSAPVRYRHMAMAAKATEATSRWQYDARYSVLLDFGVSQGRRQAPAPFAGWPISNRNDLADSWGCDAWFSVEDTGQDTR
jgi:hypothetical protein